MRMDPNKVKKLIGECQIALMRRHVSVFDCYIKDLAEALDGIIIGEIDMYALVHSFDI